MGKGNEPKWMGAVGEKRSAGGGSSGRGSVTTRTRRGHLGEAI